MKISFRRELRHSVGRILLLTALGVPLIAPTSYGQGSSNAVSTLRHDYDPVSDQETYRTLDALHSSLGQTFTSLGGAEEISGFRMKIRRLGNPPDILFRIGSRYGADDIARGRIPAGTINPFFEFFYGDDFLPRPCRAGKEYSIQLSLDGKPDVLEGYEIWGTTIEGENPANRDYGARTADYLGGEALDPAGQPIPRVDFAFEVFFGPKQTAESSNQEQPRFSFVNDLLRGPHAETLRDPDVKPNPNEFLLDGSWRIVAARSRGEVEETALADFRRYLEVAMQVEMRLEMAERMISSTYRKALIVGTKDQLPELASGLDRPESYHIEADADRVAVCGFDERGVMRGLIYLEDLMNFKRAPILTKLSLTQSPRLSPRITCAPFNTNADLDGPDTAYTDGVLSLISHYGFNAIWIRGDFHELGRSAIFLELGKEAQPKLERLNNIIQHAHKYGIDVYLYLTKGALPAEFFVKRTEVRGNPYPLRRQGRGYLMCTSAPAARTYLEEATASIFNHAPGLQGIIFIIGGEGFLHDCMATRITCPRCANLPAVDVVSDLIATIDRGARHGKPDADVVVWPYVGGSWSKGDPAQLKIIERLPKDVILLANFETQQWVERDGVGDSVYDYSISNLGSSERFLKQADALGKRGIRLWAKTEFNTSQEFIQTPCIPVPQLWAERFRRISAIPQISGAFMNWQHYGFMPSLCAEIAKWYTWTPQPGTEDLLRQIARRDFGEGSEEKAVQAWQHFSDAIGYYPFSEGITRRGPIQTGPAHPLFFDREYHPLYSFARSFSNDLSWTEPYGPDITAKYFRLMEKEWAPGVDLFAEVARSVQGKKKANAQHERGVAEALLSCMRTTLNVIDFYRLREQLSVEKDTDRAKQILLQMIQIAQRELANAEQILPVVKADSRIGYANSGKGEQMGVGRGGIYTPRMIEKKIADLRRLLEVDAPGYRARLEGSTDQQRRRYYESEAVGQKYYDEQVDQIEHYLDTRLNQSAEVRKRHWHRDFSSLSAYQRSIEPYRHELIQMIGGPSSSSRSESGEGSLGRISLSPHRVQVAEEAAYRIYRVWFDALPGLQTYGILLVPNNLPRGAPALICIHGLGSSPEQVTGLIEREDYTEGFGRRAAERGYVVFAPLMTNSGELKSHLDRKAIMVGSRLQWIEQQKMIRAVDYLRTLTEVNPKRIGVYGISWGGRTAMYLAALDPRIAATVISGHFNDVVQKMVVPSPHYTPYILTAEDYAFFPNLANEFSDADVASLICPRPVFVEQGTRDPVVYYPLAERAFAELKSYYAELGVADRAEMNLFDGEHIAYGKDAFVFLDKWLAPRK